MNGGRYYGHYPTPTPLTCAASEISDDNELERVKFLIKGLMVIESDKIKNYIYGAPEYHEAVGAHTAYEQLLKEIEVIEKEDGFL